MRERYLYYICLSAILFSSSVNANPVLPGAADAGRLITTEKIYAPQTQAPEVNIPKITDSSVIPHEAKIIKFELKKIKIEGMTVFDQASVSSVYEKYINKTISLDTVWLIADEITKKYQDAGYFLSRAYIPEQRIKDGIIIIKAVEGCIGEVELPDDVKKHNIVQKYIEELMSVDPITSKALESFLLKMSDLPGYSFRSVISPMDKKHPEDNRVKLTLIASKAKAQGMISYDNFASRYVGSNEVSSAYSTSLIPLHQTTISASSSIPTDLASYATLDHKVFVAPNTIFDVNISTTKTYPGYTLKPYSIESGATSFGAGFNYQHIRQRQENLMSKLMFTNTNITTNSLGFPLTRDHVRAIRTGFSYTLEDKFYGSNLADFTVSRGVYVFDSSKASDPYLSRYGAKPNFTKAQLTLSRLQTINSDWSAYASTTGQLASGTLYSTEQIGYGGQAFGRAYDSSEITGDEGLNGSLELRYDSIAKVLPKHVNEMLSMQVFSFYDIGVVRNKVAGSTDQSGASAGLGLRFVTKWKQVGSVGIAWPLTRKIATPMYNCDNPKSPRIMLQFSQEF